MDNDSKPIQKVLECNNLCEWDGYIEKNIEIVESTRGNTENYYIGEATLASPYFKNFDQRDNAIKHYMHKHSEVKNICRRNYNHFRNDKIRLGFVGKVFYDQATLYLMIAFLEKMNKNKFELYAFDDGLITPQTSFVKRINAVFNKRIRITKMTDDEAVKAIEAEEIDILISIQDPANTRIGIFAKNPANKQISYLYYPATTGIKDFDYIIADKTVIPPENEYAFTENILYMDCCYQPNDNMRFKPEINTMHRIDQGVKIVANFGALYKITPFVFDTWCKILKEDKDLWLMLMSENDTAKKNLWKEMEKRGLDYRRLIFTERLNTKDHLKRFGDVKFILDTWPYNGHTLTSDALWANTPVLTMQGKTFASKVAASININFGMSEFVCNNEEEYIDRAFYLAKDTKYLTEVRNKFLTNKYNQDLFDPFNYANEFSRLMQKVYLENW
jgi:predicted O-linked N-acetylglucosamine transferase (SPINDLY family)